MIKYLENEMTKGLTDNGAPTYTTSLNANVDFFGLAGAMRGKSKEAINLFIKAFSEDELCAVRNLFYIRDVRGGQGERQVFRDIMEYLGKNYSNITSKILKYVPEFGRWDDLAILASINSIRNEVISLIKFQLDEDIKSNTPSLLGKWLPSENATSQKTKFLAKIIRQSLGLTPREYRKTLSKLRAKIGIVETKITNKDYDLIDYSKLPSNAGMKYRQAFFRNDENRYKAFIDSVNIGEKKINTATLYPHEIVQKARYASHKEISLYDGMWKNLPNYTKDENAMVVADVSGSMSGTPIDVAISLAMYFAERNKGEYNGYFMTFSDKPQLVKIVGKTLTEKINMIERADWEMNTNVEAIFETILSTAIKYNLSQDEMIKKIYIVSDMQFDRCVNGGTNKTIFENAKKKFKKAGYELPTIVFWNVNASVGNLPVRYDDNGTALVSGYSPTVFKYAMSGGTPVDFMLEIINSPRYAIIEL